MMNIGSRAAANDYFLYQSADYFFNKNDLLFSLQNVKTCEKMSIKTSNILNWPFLSELVGRGNTDALGWLMF